MAVDDKHPDYALNLPIWNMMRHADKGSEAVKDQGATYLPMPSGFTNQADGGVAMYRAYALRAKFPELVEPTKRGMVGIIHRMEPQVEMPSSMEPLWENATLEKLPLEALHRRITEELLLQGRYSLMVDVPTEGANLPYIVPYAAEFLINWDDVDRNLFVLDETRYVRNGFSWTPKNKYRVLQFEGETYSVRVFDQDRESASQTFFPSMRGGNPLKEIPFVVIGPNDLAIPPAKPPLKGVAEAAYSIFRLDADYRHQLFHSGQETLFITGMGSNDPLPTVIGAGVVHGLPEGAEATFVGPSGSTIEAHRTAIMDERENAVAAATQLFDKQSGQESGEALRLRYAAQTATLISVAQASALGLEKALRYVAMFLGEDPEKVVVTPNLKFVETVLTPAEALQLVTMWQSQAISYETLYENLRRGEITSSERDAQDELALIEAENPIDPAEFEDEGGGEDALDDELAGE